MNLEWILALVLFITAVLLALYVGKVAAELISLKLVFEATKNAKCGSHNSTGRGLVVATCLEITYNKTLLVKIYNITVDVVK